MALETKPDSPENEFLGYWRKVREEVWGRFKTTAELEAYLLDYQQKHCGKGLVYRTPKAQLATKAQRRVKGRKSAPGKAVARVAGCQPASL